MTTTAMDAGSAIGTVDFIKRFGLWTPEQDAAAERMAARVSQNELRTVRVSMADQHGKLRGKTVLAGLIPSVLRNGIDFSTAIWHFDTADTIVYNAFEKNGLVGDTELTGFPDVVLVPDPLTFVELPWAPGTGWCLGNAYYNDGRPVPYDARQQLKRQLDVLESQYGLRLLAGLEVEFYLARLVGQSLTLDSLGGPGVPPAPPEVAPIAPGYAYQSEDHQDQIEDVLATLADNIQAVGLPLRTMEDEWGPGQCEFTFSPIVGLHAADAMLLFKTVVKQVGRRLGLHASFMCSPGLPGYFASGWHLHQSLIDANGVNVFSTAASSSELLSETAKHYLAGILEHACDSSVFTTPTINGYRRRKPYSLAPDRATWGVDNRAAMLRVQGSAGDPATHVENRVGEPAANPYLYLASQVISGLDGLNRKLELGPAELEPYTATHRPLLPTTLMEATSLLNSNTLYRGELGDRFVDWILGLKKSEIDRFLATTEWNPDVVSDWEHREYFSQY